MSTSPDVDVDLSDLAFWALPPAEREKVFAALRAHAPVSRHRPPDDVLGIAMDERTEYWAVVRYDDVRRVSRDPATFCSGQGVMFGDAPPELLEASQSFLAMDDPRHAKLRGLVSAAFTPRQIRRLEERIAANARIVVDEAAATGGGDFVELVSKRLPLMMFSEMVGVPESDREALVAAADVLVSVADPEFVGDRNPLELMGQSLFTLHSAATEIAGRRAAHPEDDLMTALVEAEVDGERLTHAEIAAFFVLISVAANDTTRHTTSHAMRALTEHPEQKALLIAEPARMAVAVEEFVRWATPVMTFRRTATRDVELNGVPIAAGERVVMFYTSANRDEAAFAAPERFDITRDPNRHVGFGGGGPHYCLGASLARTQLRTLFTELLGRLPDIEAGEPEMLAGAFINGVKRMPCAFTPSA